MWKATRIRAEASNEMQTNAGLLLNKFDIENPVRPADVDIICETTGDFSITCKPTTEDFFADVNGAPTNTLEGKTIVGWECGLGVTALSVSAETLKLSLGAVEEGDDDGFHPRSTYKADDFKSLYWIGDMLDETKLFVVVMDNTVSTGGLSFTATNKGKGQLALELTPHATAADPEKVPMAFYILEKVDEEQTEAQTNDGEQPAAQTETE